MKNKLPEDYTHKLHTKENALYKQSCTLWSPIFKIPATFHSKFKNKYDNITRRVDIPMTELSRLKSKY